MRNTLILIIGVAALNYFLDWGSLMHVIKGYEDHISALMISALLAPLLAPVFE